MYNNMTDLQEMTFNSKSRFSFVHQENTILISCSDKSPWFMTDVGNKIEPNEADPTSRISEIELLSYELTNLSFVCFLLI